MVGVRPRRLPQAQGAIQIPFNFQINVDNPNLQLFYKDFLTLSQKNVPTFSDPISIQQFIILFEEIKNKLAKENFADLCEQWQATTDKQKDALRLFYEALHFEMMAAFLNFLSLNNIPLEAKAPHLPSQPLKKMSFAVIAVGALLSEASDGFLGGTTLAAKANKVGLLIAGICSAGIHALLHYMVNIYAAKHEWGIESRKYITPTVQLHTAQLKVTADINEIFLQKEPGYFGSHKNYIDYARIGFSINKKLQEKRVAEYKEPLKIKIARWTIGLSDGVINGGFGYYAIFGAITGILLLCGLGPPGWAVGLIMGVAIVAAAFATTVNLLSDMNLGLFARFNPAFQQIRALREKIKRYDDQHGKFVDTTMKKIISRIRRPLKEQLKDLQPYLECLKLSPAINQLEEKYRAFTEQYQTGLKAFPTAVDFKKLSRPLEIFQKAIEQLKKQTEFYESYTKVIDFFKFCQPGSRPTLLQITANNEEIQKCLSLWKELKKCVADGPRGFNTDERKKEYEKLETAVNSFTAQQQIVPHYSGNASPEVGNEEKLNRRSSRSPPPYSPRTSVIIPKQIISQTVAGGGLPPRESKRPLDAVGSLFSSSTVSKHFGLSPLKIPLSSTNRHDKRLPASCPLPVATRYCRTFINKSWHVDSPLSPPLGFHRKQKPLRPVSPL